MLFSKSPSKFCITCISSFVNAIRALNHAVQHISTGKTAVSIQAHSASCTSISAAHIALFSSLLRSCPTHAFRFLRSTQNSMRVSGIRELAGLSVRFASGQMLRSFCFAQVSLATIKQFTRILMRSIGFDSFAV